MQVTLPTVVIQGDARRLPLPDESVQCVVTSPPYWGLRDYGLEGSVWGGEAGCRHEWGDEMLAKPTIMYVNKHTKALNDGWTDSNAEREVRQPNQGAFCRLCGAWRGCLGLEPTPELYVNHMVEIFREVRRVLRSDGTVWLNLGDSYAGGSGSDPYRRTTSGGMGPGLKPKDLCGIPWRVAFALQADGWWLRSDIIWHKPNPMPESVTDRPTKSHEYLFLLTKSKRYFFDQEAVREKGSSNSHGGGRATGDRYSDKSGRGDRGQVAGNARPAIETGGRNVRSVWRIATQPYSGAHFATMPPKLVEPCIKAGTSEKGACPECGAPWERVVGKGALQVSGHARGVAHSHIPMRNDQGQDAFMTRQSATTGWRPGCDCAAGDPVPCLAVDPFGGAGTVAYVAMQLGRRGVVIDANGDYCQMAWRRLQGKAEPVEPKGSLPLFEKIDTC